MSSTDMTLPAPGGAHAPAENYLTAGAGLRSWLTTLDHKRIGILYLVSILTAFLVGGLTAMLIRTQLWRPEGTIFSPDAYNKLFTLHGAVMIFLFLIPGIPGALGNFVLPIMLGAKDVAFPRLNLASWYMYLAGAALAIMSVVLGGVDTGWTFYTPYSTTTSGPVIWLTLGVFILGFSSIFTGVNFITTIHKLRAPGMGWFRMPLFAWGLYGTAILQVLATPVLGITVLLLTAERVFGIGIFDPSLGGDPILYQHFFWFYSHPAVYIMILPAMGVISELISVFSHRHIFGYKFIAYSSIAIAVLSFLVWGHHMFVSGQSSLATTIFSVMTFAVAIPSAVKVFNWLATMYKGSIDLKAPMLCTLAFLWVFGIGGLTGLFLGAMATDVHLHDTYFVVAHFHYVMMGATVFAFLGGFYYWFPKMFGRMYNETVARWGWLAVFLGFNLTFFPQFVLGTQGMPRRYAHYLPQFEFLHRLSTIGSFLLGLGFFVVAAGLVHALFRGRQAPANPWGGATLEWRTSSPPPHDNFAETPTAGDPYDLADIEYDPQIGGFRPRTAGGAAGA